MNLDRADLGSADNLEAGDAAGIAANAVSTGPAASIPLEDALAPWLRVQKRSMLRQMVTLVSKPGILSLAGGLPEPSLFPREEFAQAYAEVLRSEPRSLQYGGSSEQLKQQIVELAALRGITATPEQVVLTTGAQQGIDIGARALLQENGVVLVEEMSYTGIHQTCAPRSPSWLEAPVDLASGGDPVAADALVTAHLEAGGATPDLCYLIPDGHNPLGVSMSADRRAGWSELLRRHGIPLIEDDPYGLVWFDQPFDPPLKSLAPDNTLYLSSFSKILAPGVRLGYMIVPEVIAERIGVVKESGDLECSGLTQRAVTTLLETGFLDRHLDRVRSLYAERRDALLAALQTHLDGVATWSKPQGGMFAWVELADQIDTVALLQQCIEHEQVAFLPGIAFAGPSNEAAANQRSNAGSARALRAMRLSFSTLTPNQFDPAIAAIARQIQRTKPQ